MTLAILGIGTAVPGPFITQTDALNIARALCCRTAEHETWLPSMYHGTGIGSRHICLGADLIRDILEGTRHSGSIFLPSGKPDDRGPTTQQRMQFYAESAPPLALAASKNALDQSGLSAAALTHLITVSCTGFLAPGVDVALIRGLGLSPTIQRSHVGYMGCHGAINGLRIASAFTGADPAARVLLCAVELCSVHYHYGWDPQKIVANALFSDGAAAVVGVSVEHSLRECGLSDSTRGAIAPPETTWRVAASGSCLVPNSTDSMTWSIGNHGFDMTLSKRVPKLIETNLRPWMEDWLRGQGVALADVK